MDSTFFSFLKDLSENNNRDWFTAHKGIYEQSVKIPFENLIGNALSQIAEKDARFTATIAKNCIYRIYRDTRFSPDKTPYKNHVSASITPYGAKNKEFPGFYLQMGADNIMLGGGAYFLEKETLQKVRKYISINLDEFLEVINDKEFLSFFGQIRGEANKRMDKDWAEILKIQPLIANKQFYFMSEVTPNPKHNAQDILKIVLKHYEASKKVTDFLQLAIKN